jgi:hypothetical protein
MSYDSLYRKVALSPEQIGPESSPETACKLDPARHISPVVAHELNNILTVVQGYSDCLLLTHHEDAELQPQLKMISEASRRATAIIREAISQNVSIIPAMARPD